MPFRFRFRPLPRPRPSKKISKTNLFCAIPLFGPAKPAKICIVGVICCTQELFFKISPPPTPPDFMKKCFPPPARSIFLKIYPKPKHRSLKMIFLDTQSVSFLDSPFGPSPHPVFQETHKKKWFLTRSLFGPVKPVQMHHRCHLLHEG